MSRRHAGLLTVAAALLAASAAPAASVQEQAFARWKIQDQCVADSIKLHPDRDAAAQRQRDAAVDKCLADHHLPPRAHMAPPAAAPASAAPS